MQRLSGFQGGKPDALRPPDARMLSRWFEVPPHRSGGTRRGNNPKSRCDRLGRGLGPWNGWRRPKSVVILSVLDMNVPMPLALAWRKDNKSPLLANFVVNV